MDELIIERVAAAIAANLDVEPDGQLTRDAARAAIAAFHAAHRELWNKDYANFVAANRAGKRWKPNASSAE